MLDDAVVDEIIAANRVNIFRAIRTSVDQMVRATVPPGKTLAMIAHADLRGHLTFGVAGKVGDHWEFSASLETAFSSDTPMTASVSVIGSW